MDDLIEIHTPGEDIESVAIDTLNLDVSNARKGSIPAIVASLQEHGQHRPVVAQRSTRNIIAGNHLVMAAQELGWDTIVVWWKDDTDREALHRSLSDNMSSDQASWDETQLRALLLDFGDDVAGGDESLISMLMKDLDSTASAGIEEPTYPIMARPGEVYDYVIIYGDNQIDKAWLHTYFNMREQSYKSQTVGRSRLYSVKDFRDRISKALVEDGSLVHEQAGSDDGSGAIKL